MGSYAHPIRSDPAPELDNPAAIAFRWPARGQLFELSHRLTFSRHLQSQFTAFFRLVVKGLRNRSRAAHLAEQQHFHMKLAAIVGDAQHVSNPNRTRRLGGLPAGLNPAEFTGPGCQGSRFKKSGGPKPLVDSNGCAQIIFPPTLASLHR